MKHNRQTCELSSRQEMRLFFASHKPLETGAFGAVFKARNKQTSQTVAIKFISVEEDNAVNEVCTKEKKNFCFFLFFFSLFFFFFFVLGCERDQGFGWM